jgi:hypothetical protein
MYSRWKVRSPSLFRELLGYLTDDDPEFRIAELATLDFSN